ncbi:MAG: UvrD-helicase domain-containing protein [Verrucomicrobiales bacterium]|nr:UvrD-helicase domain-containing protein [Verrucomicrobiales bacterium]
MSAALRHELISASAGSGKTYQLVRRYLHLLALGVDPPSIAAMTFTRKAAGEFFSRILNQLARLADGTEDASAYFADLCPPLPEQTDFRALLVRVTRQMQRLRLGTLDSFFASVASCFPLELGLPAGAAVMAQEETEERREEALNTLLDRLHRRRDETQLQLIHEAVKQSSFGAEEKRQEDVLRGWIKEGQDLWLSSDGTDAWGNPDRIWPASDALPSDVSLASLPGLVANLRDQMPALTAKGATMLDELAEQVTQFEPGVALPTRVEFFLKKTAELLADGSEVTWGKKIALSDSAQAAWMTLARSLLALEVSVRAYRTRGLARVLALFEEQYDRSVRQRGQLSFADIPRLLSQLSDGSAAEAADALWFRLDGRFDHWMFDEFQDTSFSQWNVVQPLVSEALQDAEGRRSFFAVGDPKQSIYLWRQAEPGLFDELLEQNPAAGEYGLHPGTLSQSYRATPEVLQAVNGVFQDRARLRAALGPEAVKPWRFEPHTAAPRTADTPGYSAFFSAIKPDDDAEEPAFGKPAHRLAAAILREVRPVARGLSCAVLVRANNTALALTEVLRAELDEPVTCESQIHPATDNAATLALLSLLQLACHPGDTLALQHLRMTPLVALLPEADTFPADLVREILRLIQARGFAGFTATWIAHLRELDPMLDAFHQLRLQQFSDLAAEFDASGSRDIDTFLRTARSHPLRRRGAEEAIHVMTIHASKGLEFDVVLMPELDSDSMSALRSEQWLVDRQRGQTEWVLQAPKSEFIRADLTLSARRQREEARAAFESLCRLYVGMTRARRALFLIAEPPPKSGTAMKASRLLRETLAVGFTSRDETVGDTAATLEWECGNRWWEEMAFTSSPQPAPPPSLPPGPSLGTRLRQVQARQRRRTPSGSEAFHLPGRVLFAPGRDHGRLTGVYAHQLLAEIEWLPGSDLPPLPADADADWRAAHQLVTQALQQSAIHQVLARPTAEAGVWRERAFDFVAEGEWISGTFDRLVHWPASADRQAGAHLVDYKTDDVSAEGAVAERITAYRPQIELYRIAAARLTGLAPEQVQASLVFLRAGSVVEIPAS